MTDILTPYCLNECDETCCKGTIRIDPGYVRLFKTFKLTGKEVPVAGEDCKKPHLYKSQSTKKWYFSGDYCPNYNPEIKHCLIHSKHPMCDLFPLVNLGNDSYQLSKSCKIHSGLLFNNPLETLAKLCKKHDIKLYMKSRGGIDFDVASKV